MDIIQTRKRVNSLLSDLNLAKRQCKKERDDLKKARTTLAHIEEAQQIAQQIAQTIQQQAHTQIAGVVSRCLKAVFVGEDEYGFKIRFEMKRGKTEAILILTKNGHEIEDPLEADSGGVVDVAAFALRLACLTLAKPKLSRFLAMDEPFKFVSEEFLDNVKAMLESLSEDFKFQFPMITHIKGLECGKVIRL